MHCIDTNLAQWDHASLLLLQHLMHFYFLVGLTVPCIRNDTGRRRGGCKEEEGSSRAAQLAAVLLRIFFVLTLQLAHRVEYHKLESGAVDAVKLKISHVKNENKE